MCLCVFLFLGGQCCAKDAKQFPLNDTKGIAKCAQEINPQSKFSQGNTKQHINNKFPSARYT